jgi:hypothetical protein
MTDTAFAGLWKEAVKDYERWAQVLLEKASADADTPGRVQALLVEKYKDLVLKREKGEKLRSVMQPILHVIDQMGEIVGEAVSVVCLSLVQFLRRTDRVNSIRLFDDRFSPQLQLFVLDSVC